MTSRRVPLWFVVGFAAAWCVGLALRLTNLRAQVLGGDELHSVRLSMSTPLAKILFRHTDFDHGRPLTALYRLAMDAGLVFDELTFRLPMLACGLVLVVLLPLCALRTFGRGVALSLAWLLAASPALVLYSRIVRTYVPVTLASSVAVLAFFAWLQTGRARAAMLYVVATVTTVFTHLLAAPFVLAPLVFALGERLLWRRGMAFRRWLALAALTALALIAVHLPLWDGLTRLAATRAGQSSIDLRTLWGVLRLQAGSAHAVEAPVFAGLVLLGAARALCVAPRLVLYLATLAVLHASALVAIGPKQADSALVFNRYVLPATPFLLGAVAVALGRAWGGARWARVLQPAAVALAIVSMFLAGPLWTPDFRRGSFAHHNRLVSFVDARELASLEPPESYARLEGAGAILEFPWNPHWNHSLATLAYQRVHGREVVVAGRQITATHPRVLLHNAVPIDVDPLAAFLESRARWLVVHLDAQAEEERFLERDGVQDDWEEMRRDALAVARSARARWGPPQLFDAAVLIWDLDRVR